MRALAAAGAVLVFAVPASASSNYTDPVGDTAGPDVTGVAVSNDLDNVTIQTLLPNRATLAAGDVVLVDLDLDGNKATGEDGVDLYAAFEGGEDPIAFAWRDGAFTETADAKAAFASGAASLIVPLNLVTGNVGVAVLAVGGPDPDVSPTDRAPDSGSWTYVIEKPALRHATVRFKPAEPKAGKTFAVASVSLELTVGGTVDADASCRATLGGKRLVGQGCAWKIPKQGRGKQLVISINAAYGDLTFPLPARKFKVR